MKRKIIKYNLITMVLIGSCAANATNYSGNYTWDTTSTGSDTTKTTSQTTTDSIQSGSVFNIAAQSSPLGKATGSIFSIKGTMDVEGGSIFNMQSVNSTVSPANTGTTLFSVSVGGILNFDNAAGRTVINMNEMTSGSPAISVSGTVKAKGLDIISTRNGYSNDAITLYGNSHLELTDSTISSIGSGSGYGLDIWANGASAIINNTSISTNNMGVLLTGTSSVEINNSSIMTSSGSAYGLYAASGGVITGNNYTFASLGDGASAIYASDNSRIEISNLHAMAAAGRGAQANAATATVILHGGDILTGVRLGKDSTNLATYGKPVDASGNLVTNPAQYIAAVSPGIPGNGVEASNGAKIYINPNASDGLLTIRTMNPTAQGISASVKGLVIGDKINISTSGNGSSGVSAFQAGHITLTNTNIVTTGGANQGVEGARGIAIASDGVVDLTHGTITTNGSLGYGIHATDKPSSSTPYGAHGNTIINIDDVAIITKGTTAHGSYTELGGINNILNSSIVTSGKGAHGVSSVTTGLANIDTLSLAVSGIGGIGINATDAGRISLYDNGTTATTITTNGVNGTGVFVSTNGSAAIVGKSDSQRIQIQTNGNSDKTQLSQGAGAAGAALWYSGSMNLTNVDIKTNGGPQTAADYGAVGIWARAVAAAGATEAAGNDTTINTTNVSVTTQNGHGIMAENGAHLTLDGIKVDATKGNGLFAEKYSGSSAVIGSSIIGQNVDIKTTNGESAVFAHDGGQITLAGTTKVNGVNSHGLKSESITQATLVDATGIDINVSGNGKFGVYALAGSADAIANVHTNSQIIATGDNGIGIRAANQQATINITDSNVTASGQNGTGADALHGGVVNLNNSYVTASGANSVALSSGGIATSGTSIINANNVIAKATDATGNGAQLYGNGTVNLTNSELSGQQHGVLFAYNNNMGTFSDGGTNVFNVDGGKLTSASGDAFHFDDTLNAGTTQLNADILVKNGAQITAGSGILLNALSNNANVINFTADTVDLNGAIFSDGSGSSVTNVYLQNGANLTGKIMQSGSAAINVDTQANTQWTYTDSSDIHNLNNSGSIISNSFSGNSQSQSDYKLLTVNGNYSGNNGLLVLNTYLGNDSAPTDRLVVKGDTSGDTRLKIINTRTIGDGDSTQANGIEVISVAGNSGGNFALEGGAVSKGAYDYFLHKGGVDQDAGNGNWYLRNTYPVDPVTPVDPVDPVVPVDPVGPVTPVTPRGGDTPTIVNPATGNYIANAYADNWMFMHTLHDRLGEPQYTDKVKGEIEKPTSMWLRVVGSHAGSRAADSQLKLTTNTYMVQGGGDIAQWSRNGDDRYHVGVMMGYGNAHNTSRSTISGLDTKGTTDGYSAGLYATWYQNDNNVDREGMYVDSWVQYGWFNNTVTNTRNAGRSDDNYSSDGISASLETGYAFKLHENANKESLFIEPQVQIVWAGVTADDHTDGTGTRISQEDNGAWISRLGARLYANGHHKMDDGKDRTFQPFVEANWIHNSSDYSYKFDNVSIKQDGAKNIAELKLGVEGQLNKQWTVWTHVGQQLGDKGFNRTDALVGVKYMF